MHFNAHDSTRHFLEEREGLGKTELQTTGGNKVPVRCWDTGKQEAQTSFLSSPIAPRGSQQRTTLVWRKQPSTAPLQRTGGCFHTAPSGSPQSPPISEQNTCQNKEITYTVLAGRQKEQEALLKWVAQKADLNTTTYVLKRLRVPHLRGSGIPGTQRDGTQAQLLLCSHLRRSESPISHDTASAAKRMPSLSLQAFKYFSYFSWLKLIFVFHLMSKATVSKAQIDSTPGCSGTSYVDYFKHHIV